jgi:hypothetical protein
MDGQDIKSLNDTMPRFPKRMPLWQRILCVLGYHKWESRKAGPGRKLLVQGMKLRDQCGRCDTLR